MRKSYFAKAFQLATEDGSSDATVLPVVLEIDVKATDGTSPAQDPALDDSSTDLDAAKTATENDDGSEPLDAPAGDANETLEEFENNLITTDDLEAAETEHELEEQLNEEAVVEENVSEVEEIVKTQEEVLNEHPENVNKESVGIATECLYRAVKNCGLDPKTFQSLNQLTIDYLSSEDFNSPIKALRIVHEDSKSFLQSAKDGLKRLWEMIVNSLKKLWELVKRIFGNHVAIATKLKQKLNQMDFNPEGKTVEIYKFLPAVLYASENSTEISNVEFSLYRPYKMLLDGLIKISNISVEKINSGEKMSSTVSVDFNKGMYEILRNHFPKIGSDYIIALGARKISIANIGKGIETKIIKEDDIKKKKIDRFPTKQEINEWLNIIIDKIGKENVKTLELLVKNAERVKPENLKSKFTQYLYKNICGNFIRVYESNINDASKGILKLAKHCIDQASKKSETNTKNK